MNIIKQLKRFPCKIKKLWKWIKLLWNDQEWDYAYMLDIEQHKMKNMLDYFTKINSIWTNTDLTKRDLKICIKLIDIIAERDESYQKYLNDNYSEWLPKIKNIKIPVYVNTKNAKRFWKNYETWNDSYIFNMELRREKAWRLYNLIREHQMLRWWSQINLIFKI